MTKLRSCSGKTLVKIFESIGFVRERQKGSHIIMHKPGVRRPLVIPDHKELSINSLYSNLKTAGLTREQYLLLLEEHQ